MALRLKHYARTGGTRVRFDGKFEVQYHPKILRCELNAADWNLIDSATEQLAIQLNTSFSAAVHDTANRAAVEQKMAMIAATLPVTADERNGVLMVVDRLTRAVFE